MAKASGRSAAPHGLNVWALVCFAPTCPGNRLHGSFLYEENLRTPLLIRAASLPAGAQRSLRPSTHADGSANIIGALRKAMATTGYSDLKEFQRIDVVLDPE